ncbi:MAG: hypothetical protein HY909_11425 [Deltaproteobacteria bacterium]|nr:hypothetical protein [Deltaproteobacteria bacterium]
MDDELKRRIAGSLDLPADGLADPVVARALAEDPGAARYALELRSLDRALRRWPAPGLAPEALERLTAQVDHCLDGVAKVRRSETVSRQEPGADPGRDPAGVPQFEDEPKIPTESIQTMSEPNEPEASTEGDSDLEGLAALARTSLGPAAMGASRRPSAPAITDAVDETSSGIVDIKHLVEIARSSVSVPPQTVTAEPAKVEPKAEAAAAAPGAAPTTEAKAAADKGPSAPRVIAPPVEPVPARRSGGALWGALGGIAASALAFFFWTQSQSQREALNTATTPLESPAESSGAAPLAAPPAPATPAVVAAPPASAPTGSPTAEAPALVPGPTAFGAPPAGPVAQGAAAADQPAQAATRSVAAESAAPEPRAPQDPAAQGAGAAPEGATGGLDDRRARRGRDQGRSDEPQRDRAEVERTPAAPTVAAAPTPPPPPAPPTRTAAPANPTTATPSAQPAARPPGGSSSIADLLNQAAPTPARNAPTLPAAPAPAAAPGELPERPNRQMVTSVLSPLSGAVRACAQGQTGTAPVAITIGNDGTVRSASVGGQFAGTPVGECIAGVVRRAHFQPFRAPQANVTWPFVILPPR